MNYLKPRESSKRVRIEWKRSHKEGLSVTNTVKIAVEGPWYFSGKEEDLFYSWLKSIPSVHAVGGVGTTLEITFATKRIPQRDLREILALFHRYKMDMRVLAEFDRPELQWFRDPKKYWYVEVFGRRSRARRA